MNAAEQLEPAPRSAGRTHVGRVRIINEDRLLDCPERALWAVADGMGGHSAGDVAATLAIGALHRLASADTIDRPAIAAALGEANGRIFEAGARGGGMSGSTVAGLALGDTHATVFWIGDSRVYRWRAGTLEQLTHDHSLVQELVDAGALTELQARNHPRANVVTRALGVDAAADVAFAEVSLGRDDRFLLCSDGLSGMVEEAAIARAMALPVAAAADALIAAAIAAGGRDNVTVVVVDA